MGKLTGKSKHTVKVGNHPHTNMISKPVIMRGRDYKCRIFEIHLKLRDKQLKTIMYVYVCVYTHTHTHTHTQTAISKLHGNCKPKCIIDTYTHTQKKESNTRLKKVIKSEEKKTKEERKNKTSPKQSTKWQ